MSTSTSRDRGVKVFRATGSSIHGGPFFCVRSATYTTIRLLRDDMVAIGEHYRSMGDVAPDGIYRIVGTTELLTLLRVADVDGRRRHTGETVSVPPKAFERNFERADDPDSGFTPLSVAWDAVRNLYWSLYAAWLAIRRRL